MLIEGVNGCELLSKVDIFDIRNNFIFQGGQGAGL